MALPRLTAAGEATAFAGLIPTGPTRESESAAITAAFTYVALNMLDPDD